MPKTIVITGCSSGLGRATALHFAALGWQVFATVRKEADLTGLLVEAMGKGWADRLVPVLCDITQADDVARLARVVADATPTLDALLNNAGTGHPGPLEILPIAEVRAQLEVNVLAHLAVTQALLPLLKPAHGTLIMVSSIGGRIVYPVNGAYHMSKFALEAMSDALRIELAPSGVRVVIVEPGSSPTPIWDTSFQRGLSNAALQQAKDYAPLIAAVQRLALADAARGFPPEQFARLVERIVTSRRPAARYTLPWFVGPLIFIREHLPDRLWDWGVRRVLKW